MPEHTFTATDTISVSGRSPTTGAGSSISTSTLGEGAAGNISLIASDVAVAGGAQSAAARAALVLVGRWG